MKLVRIHVKGEPVTISQKILFTDHVLFHAEKPSFRFHEKLGIPPAVTLDHHTPFGNSLRIFHTDLLIFNNIFNLLFLFDL